MFPDVLINGLLLISISCFITFCSSTESKNNILLDITEQIKSSSYSRAKIDTVVKSFINHNTDIGNKQDVTLYYEHFYDNGTYDFQTAVNRMVQLESRIWLLINVKAHENIDNVNDIGKFVKFRYSGILDIVAKHTLISSVSFEFIDVRNICSNNTPATNTTLIEEVQQLLRSFTARDLKIGYKLNYTQLKCRQHSRYIKDSNYLVINIPLKRNDKIFVESFDVFKNNMKQISERVKSIVHDLHGGNYTRPIYFKLILRTNLNLENVQRDRCVNGLVTGDSLKIIQMASENIENVQAEYMNRYENLLAQYCRQLGLDGQDATFILKFSLENSNIQQALVIPQLPTLPVSDLGTSGMRSISFLLEEIVVSGFNTIMINGEIWQEMIKKGVSKSNCHIAQCRPQNVMYLNDKDYAFSNYNERNVTTLLEVDGMHLRTLIFSRYYKEKSKFNWKKAVDSLQRATYPAVGIKTGCTELPNIFGEILNNGTFGIFCHSLELRKTIGCGSLQLSSNIIVWRGKLVFNSYKVELFVENTIKKLDALLLGRQIIKNMRNDSGQNENLEIILRIKVKYEGEGKTVIGNQMYCTDLGANVYQFYEMLLTWAQIHDFTVIIEPISDTFGYDNPISWKQLEISATGRIRNLMTSFPIFIRRSYNMSRVFGSWTSGMYSCIQHSKPLGTEISFLNPSTGSTIYFNVRTGNISIITEELQVMLLFAFGKFSTVEVIIRLLSDLQVLYDTVQQPDFDVNLKENNISRKNVYIDVSISLSENQIEMVTNIVKILEKVGFQVQIHHRNTDLFRFKTGIFIENCAETANDILSTHFSMADKIRKAKYIVCDTSPKSAQNEDKNSMRDYLDSHLYLQKLFQYLFRNITGVYFRLHPRLVGSTFHEQSQNLMLFLADIHKYSKAYGIHYFILPVLSQDENMASFWTTTNLLDIDSFIERQANLLGRTNWKPILANQSHFKVSTISPSTEKATRPILALITEYSQMWDTSTETTNSTYVEPQQKMLSNLEYTLVFLGSLAVVVLIIFIIRLLRNRKNDIRKRVNDFFHFHTEPSESNVLTPNKDTQRYSTHIIKGYNKTQTVDDSQSETSFSQNLYKIKKENIKIYYDKILGSGQFGIVYRGKLKDSPFDVAVKMIHEDSPEESLKGMWSEVNLLCGIGKHSNVVGFIGCYYENSQKGILWIITELCTRGSLLSFLRDVEAETVDVQLSRRELFKFCTEVAQGMEYIGTKNIIHGDLSTRNVLLDENYTCKIGDFGLSRKLYRYEMYVKQSQEPLPWRWMAYESLKKLQFSVQSDVWSYGVTIWEIFTLGDVPYPGMSWSFDFLTEIENGLTLRSPKHTTINVNSMMQQCWKLKPTERPSFTELVKFFSDQMEINCDDDDNVIVPV